MDVLSACTLKDLLVAVDEIGLRYEITSDRTPPRQTKKRGRKRHIPSVTTVPRARDLVSGDRQARRDHSTSSDGPGENPKPSSIAAQTEDEEDEKDVRTPNLDVDTETGARGRRRKYHAKTTPNNNMTINCRVQENAFNCTELSRNGWVQRKFNKIEYLSLRI